MTLTSRLSPSRFAWLVLGMTFALAACSGRDSESPAPTADLAAPERVVNVSNWPDYIAPGLLEQFTAETGIRVNYSTFDGNRMLETKLLTGNGGYDAVVPSATFMQRHVAAGVYRPIDRAPAGELRHRLHRRAVGDPVGYADRAGQGPVVGGSRGPRAAAEAALLAIRPYVRYINTVPLLDDLAGGDLCVAVMWSGDAVRYSTFNRAALPLLAPSLSGDPAIYPPAETRARLRVMQPRTLEQTRVENRTWTRFQTGRLRQPGG